MSRLAAEALRASPLLPWLPRLLAVGGLVLAIGIGLASAHSQGGVILVTAVGAGLVLALSFRFPSYALYAYVAVLYLINGIANERVRMYGVGRLFTFVPPQVAYLADAILLSLIAFTLLLRSDSRVRPGRFDVLIALLFLHGFASWFVTGAVMNSAIAAFRLLLVMVAGYIVLRYGPYSLRTMERLVKLLWVFCLLQVPLVVYQRFVGVPLLGWGDDLIAGTFSRDTKLMGFQMMFFAMGVAALLHPAGSRWRLRMIVALIAVVGCMALANSRIAFALMPLIALVIVARRGWERPSHLVVALGVMAGLYAGALAIFVYLYGGAGSGGGREVLMYFTTPSAVYQYFFGTPEQWAGYGGRLSRGGAIVYLLANLHRYPGGLLFGAGPGMTTEFRYGAAAADDVLSALGVNVTQAGAFLSEFGVVGLLLSLALVVAGFRLAKIPTEPLTPFVRIVRDAYPACVIAFLLLQFYSRVWYEAETAFMFWVLTVLLIKARQDEARTG